ncbi:MAG: GH1 family beta-glucosidase [Actinomycetota bacterium]|nr:GH1 family beta-glucosidase [Actinomycetota bacterium]
MTFPAGFRWGAATAAYQVEGAADTRGPSIWDTFCRIPGAVVNGDTGDVACDHYRRWPEDLDLMARLGLQSYRFSIAWARVLPEGRGRPSRAGLDFYRRLVDGLLERSIEPLATLYHWDLPQRLQDEGGWPRRDTAERFAEYAALVFGELGGSVRRWITHNEPWVSAFLGHAFGTKAPGLRDWRAAAAAAHHVLLSHGLAVRAFRERPGTGEIGIALNLSPVYAATSAPDDGEAARRYDGFLNRWFLDPVLRGGYPADTVEELERLAGPFDVVRPGDLETIAAPVDFLGVNYYSRTRVRRDDAAPFRALSAPPELPITEMGWEIAPDAFVDLLVRLRRDYGPVPLVVTENGAAFADPIPTNGEVDDPDRVAFLRGHVEAVRRAVEAGVRVEGYYAWSFLDNFEWELGYQKRFGLVYVDYPTQRRIPKRSALWYRDWIAGRSTS